ncbi:MAG: hypothetical protein ACTMHL_05455 [Janibacter sp.]
MSEPQQGSGGAEARLPEVLAALREQVSSSSVEGLSEAELLEVVSALEATKGAAAALQARATAHFVAERDADARDDASRETSPVGRPPVVATERARRSVWLGGAPRGRRIGTWASQQH